jgi:hypothetical protein
MFDGMRHAGLSIDVSKVKRMKQNITYAKKEGKKKHALGMFFSSTNGN